MLGRIFLMLAILPALELIVLVWFARQTSWLLAVGMLVAAGVVGVRLLRFQGLKTLARLREEMARGTFPGDALLDGLALLMAGALLILPGLLTDIAGLLLLVPAVRGGVKRMLPRYFPSRAWSTAASEQAAPPSRDRIVEVKILSAEPAASSSDQHG